MALIEFVNLDTNGGYLEVLVYIYIYNNPGVDRIQFRRGRFFFEKTQGFLTQY